MCPRRGRTVQCSCTFGARVAGFAAQCFCKSAEVAAVCRWPFLGRPVRKWTAALGRIRPAALVRCRDKCLYTPAVPWSRRAAASLRMTQAHDDAISSLPVVSVPVLGGRTGDCCPRSLRCSAGHVAVWQPNAAQCCSAFSERKRGRRSIAGSAGHARATRCRSPAEPRSPLITGKPGQRHRAEQRECARASGVRASDAGTSHARSKRAVHH